MSEHIERDLFRVGAVAPALFRWEIRNALLVAVRRGRVSFDSAVERLNDIQALPIEIGVAPGRSSSETEFESARRFELSVYDAAYLDLAQRLSVPLMTRDARLGDAASKLGLLWGPQ